RGTAADRARGALATSRERHARDAPCYGGSRRAQRDGRPAGAAAADPDPPVSMPPILRLAGAPVRRRARRAAAPVEPVMRALALAIDGMELPAIEKISEAQAEDAF